MIQKRLLSMALAFPGQGILPQGSLFHFRKYEELLRHSLNCVDETVGSKFSKNLLDPPQNRADEWNLSTENAQIAILSTTYIIHELFEKLHGINLASSPFTTHLLGHSLGEFTALIMGKVITFEKGVALVRERGRLMQEISVSKHLEDSTMRVLVFRPSSFDLVLETTSSSKVLACVNNESQITISGEAKKVQEVVDSLSTPKKTILKQAELPVKIPFHNQVLHPIENKLQPFIKEPLSSVKRIVCNIDGLARNENVLQNTISATSMPVQWKASMDYLVNRDTEYVINFGPGFALDAINSRFRIKNLPFKSKDDMRAVAQLYGEA